MLLIGKHLRLLLVTCGVVIRSRLFFVFNWYRLLRLSQENIFIKWASGFVVEHHQGLIGKSRLALALLKSTCHQAAIVQATFVVLQMLLGVHSIQRGEEATVGFASLACCLLRLLRAFLLRVFLAGSRETWSLLASREDKVDSVRFKLRY